MNRPTSAEIVATRGHAPIYRRNQTNHCPGCAKTNWHVGRRLAECAFCATAIPISEG